MKVINVDTGKTYPTFNAAALSIGGSRTGLSYAYSSALIEARLQGKDVGVFPYRGQTWKVEDYNPRANKARQMSLSEKVLDAWLRTSGDQHTRIRAAALACKQSPYVVALTLHHHGIVLISRATLEQMFYACRPTTKTKTA